LQLKAKFESSFSCSTFKCLDVGAFNVGLIVSTCKVLPGSEAGADSSVGGDHRGVVPGGNCSQIWVQGLRFRV
jgi:hypothetical protein